MTTTTSRCSLFSSTVRSTTFDSQLSPAGRGVWTNRPAPLRAYLLPRQVFSARPVATITRAVSHSSFLTSPQPSCETSVSSEAIGHQPGQIDGLHKPYCGPNSMEVTTQLAACEEGIDQLGATNIARRSIPPTNLGSMPCQPALSPVTADCNPHPKPATRKAQTSLDV